MYTLPKREMIHPKKSLAVSEVTCVAYLRNKLKRLAKNRFRSRW